MASIGQATGSLFQAISSTTDLLTMTLNTANTSVGMASAFVERHATQQRKDYALLAKQGDRIAAERAAHAAAERAMSLKAMNLTPEVQAIWQATYDESIEVLATVR